MHAKSSKHAACMYVRTLAYTYVHKCTCEYTYVVCVCACVRMFASACTCANVLQASMHAPTHKCPVAQTSGTCAGTFFRRGGRIPVYLQRFVAPVLVDRHRCIWTNHLPSCSTGSAIVSVIVYVSMLKRFLICAFPKNVPRTLAHHYVVRHSVSAT